MNTQLTYPRDFAACIFDMDGLLIDSEPLWRESEIQILGALGIPLTDEMCKETMGMRLDAMVEHWYTRYPWEGPSQDQVGQDILNTVTGLIARRGETLPGVHRVIGCLREMGVPLALASSSPYELIEAVLARLELKDAFSIVRSAVDEEHGKPDPAVYLTTARDLGVAPETCLAFEDSPAGVASAVGAGMKVVAVPSGEDPAKLARASFLLNSLEDFLSLLG